MLKLLRPAMTRILTPLGRALADRGIGPDAVTAIGTLGTVISALLLFPLGQLAWGALLITVFVLFDLLDGVVARLGGKGGTTWGAFLDSTLDRVADAAIFAGLILYFIAGGDTLMAGVTLAGLIAGSLVSYAKARAEGLGLTADVGLAERPERLVVVLVASFFSGVGVPYVLQIGMWLLAAAGAITVVQRVAHVYRQARER
ncbi:MAG: CDP-alcohol phosphatidyltransferase family protein [Nonomuraea sp.]|nr:CDP-alcohol phosphatidyltransferase family protein [Nonomuraea sp.]NUP68638.1 CDP-alcohol phosphatidyltransferase family protein [Nonomuraea sp.]NUP81973.1 CDP-alcohol phosphatidyltransferase family protein [Nonomuraea sp.]NUS04392.1 CDP-alcohol phosphatidyltransferase family protein [Nonomuraea sp.]NUT11477.1 CDP-alcohol phosphatidyltransferase family protein [Nonomuraea sp.]